MLPMIQFVADKHEALVVGILVVFGLLEAALGCFANSKRNKVDLLVESINTVILMGLTKPLIVVLTLAILSRAIPWAEGSVSRWPFWFSLLLFLLVDDLLQYWYHRSAHEYKWLWKLHRAHHTATELGLLVSYRQAIYYYMLMPNIWWLGVYTFVGGGVPVAIGIVLKQLVIISSHSLITWDSFFHRHSALKPFLRIAERIVITPAFHHAHHAVSKVDGIGNPNGNFGNMFSIWDQIFGTATFVHAYPKEYGIPCDPQDNWQSQTFYPLIKSDKVGSELSRDYQWQATTVNEPAVLTLEPGDYLYCVCGHSKAQPFCDGSHHGTKFQPVRFSVTRKKEYRLCQCKLCAHAPFCDNSHLRSTKPSAT